jgi:hypothetical protein
VIYALIFAAAVIAARLYGTPEFALANDAAKIRAMPTWRAGLARSL